MYQIYAVIILELRLFETGKEYFQDIVNLVVVLFAEEFIFLSLYVFIYSDAIVLKYHYSLQFL